MSFKYSFIKKRKQKQTEAWSSVFKAKNSGTFVHELLFAIFSGELPVTNKLYLTEKDYSHPTNLQNWSGSDTEIRDLTV